MTDIQPQLTLIGTVHRDPQGLQRLSALLERLQPDLLTLEMSPYALRYRQTRGPSQLLRLERILERLAIETGRSLQELQSCQAVVDIHKLLALPYEYQTASDYADRHDCRLALIDIAEISALKLKRVESGLITYRNLKILTALPEAAATHRQESYTSAQALLLNNPAAAVRSAFLRQRRGLEGVGPRDQLMAEQIRRLLQDGACQHLVHIGGWVHLLEDPQGETLFSRLAECSPTRRLPIKPGPKLGFCAGA
jgi:pheromone shutdown protein TraB